MTRRLRQWWGLSTGERPLLLALMLLQPVLSLSLRLSGFARTRQWVEAWSRHASPRTATEADLAAAERLAQLGRIAGRRGPLVTTCLRQSLAVYGLLRRRGLQPALTLGVDRQPGMAVDMHAWVELEGQPLAQQPLRHRPFQPAESARTASTTADRTS